MNRGTSAVVVGLYNYAYARRSGCAIAKIGYLRATPLCLFLSNYILYTHIYMFMYVLAYQSVYLAHFANLKFIKKTNFYN